MTEQSPLLDYAPAPIPMSPGRLLRGVMGIPEVGALIPLICLIGIFGGMAPTLLTVDGIVGVLRAMQFLAIVAIGECLLLIAGELDLSVGSVVGVGSILSIHLIKIEGLHPLLAILLTVATGALVGAINGTITVKLGVPAFITTLGMFKIAREVAYLISAPLYGLPASLAAFGAARPLGVSWTFVILLILAATADLTLRFTTLGRKVYATGGNLEVARVAGINTARVKIGCFICAGMLSALAGSLLAAQYNIGQPEAGLGWELEVITGVVIGGTSLFGGVGTVAGVFLGLLLMEVLQSGLVLTGTPAHWQGVAIGAIMIAAVYVDLLRRRAKI